MYVYCVYLLCNTFILDAINRLTELIWGVLDFKRRCIDWSVYDIKVPREDKRAGGS